MPREPLVRSPRPRRAGCRNCPPANRSEEHTSNSSHDQISYAVFCLKKKNAEVGIAFHHDLMKRTPNTFRGHVLLTAALKQGLEMQGKVAERLFHAYFVNGEDVGDPAVLLGIAREFGVSAISRVEDFDSSELTAEVRAAERKVSTAVRGVPQISFG